MLTFFSQTEWNINKTKNQLTSYLACSHANAIPISENFPMPSSFTLQLIRMFDIWRGIGMKAKFRINDIIQFRVKLFQISVDF